MGSDGRSGDETKRVTFVSPRTLTDEKESKQVLYYKILEAADKTEAGPIIIIRLPFDEASHRSTRTSRRISLLGGAQLV